MSLKQRKRAWKPHWVHFQDLTSRPDHQIFSGQTKMSLMRFAFHSWIHTRVRLHGKFCRLLRSNWFPLCKTYSTNKFFKYRSLLWGSVTELVHIHRSQIWISKFKVLEWTSAHSSFTVYPVHISNNKSNNIDYSSCCYILWQLFFGSKMV